MLRIIAGVVVGVLLAVAGFALADDQSTVESRIAALESRTAKYVQFIGQLETRIDALESHDHDPDHVHAEPPTTWEFSGQGVRGQNNNYMLLIPNAEAGDYRITIVAEVTYVNQQDADGFRYFAGYMGQGDDSLNEFASGALSQHRQTYVQLIRLHDGGRRIWDHADAPAINDYAGDFHVNLQFERSEYASWTITVERVD